MNNATRMFREASAFEAKSIEFMDVCLGVAREAGLFVTQVETKCVNACEFQFEAVLSDNVRLKSNLAVSGHDFGMWTVDAFHEIVKGHVRQMWKKCLPVPEEVKPKTR
jgi:hypothetical protein